MHGSGTLTESPAIRKDPKYRVFRVSCNPPRPLMKMLVFLIPYGYMIIKTKRIPKEMTVSILGIVSMVVGRCHILGYLDA